MRNLAGKLGPIFLTFLFSVAAFATPIRPELKQLLREAQRSQFEYMPARAGWNGPEAKPKSASLNPTYEKLKYADSPQALRHQIRSLIVPDPRALGALAFLIVALRFMKMRQQHAPESTEVRGQVVVMPRPQDPAEQAA